MAAGIAREAKAEAMFLEVAADNSAAIAHGDFRLGNLLVDNRTPDVVAVLDWELATIGHPLADLAYCCLPYHMPHGVNGVRGLDGLDLRARGIPDEQSLLQRYCEGAGRDGINDWPVFLAFALFRSAAILQGVYARALQGNASNRNALEVGKRADFVILSQDLMRVPPEQILATEVLATVVDGEAVYTAE